MPLFRVNVEQTYKKIITVPTDCAVLRSYDDENYYYDIKLVVDPLLASRNNAYVINMYVNNEDYQEVKPTNLFANRTSDEIVQNIKTLQSIFAATTRVNVQDNSTSVIGDYAAIKPAKVDISSYISNENAVRLKNDLPISQTVKAIVTKPVIEAKTLNPAAPVATLNINNAAVAVGYGNFTISPIKAQEQLNELEIEGNIDPASLWTQTNTYVSTIKTLNGIKTPKTFANNRQNQENLKKLNIIASQLNITSNPRQLSDTQANQYVQILENQTRDTIDIIKSIVVPKTQVGKLNFFLRFEVSDTNGNIYQKETFNVDHGINLSNFMPTIPPSVKTLGNSNIGNVLFELEQLDPYANRLQIYRKQNNPEIRTKSRYILVDDIEAIPGNNFIYRDSSAVSINSYTYRFIPVSTEGVKAAVFTSAAVKIARGKLLPQQNFKRYPSYGIIDYDVQINGISLKVFGFHPSVINIKIYRRNLTNKQKQRTLVLSKFTREIDPALGYVFVDKNVQMHMYYQYTVELLYKDGYVQQMSNSLDIEYNPVVAGNALCSIDEVESGNKNGIPDFKFVVKYELQEQNFELLRKMLREQNLLSEYQNDINLDKKNIETFLAYTVTRLNLTTGETENFGVIPSNTFSDATFGPVKNVKPLTEDNRYKYTVTLHTRAPDTLFENLERTVDVDIPTISINNLGTKTTSLKTFSYKFKPYKWLQPLVLRTGNLISKDKHAESELSSGNVVDIKTINSDLITSVAPEILEVNALQIESRSIIIEWKINGSLNLLDHFIIKNNTFGITNVIGVAHNLASTNVMRFKYNLVSDESGYMTFSVTPVYTDYSFGNEVVSNPMVIQ